MITAYLVHLLILIFIYLLLAISLQLSLGFCGLLNFSYIAFFGTGAYCSAVLSKNGLPFLISMIIAAMLSFLLGWILSVPTNRLKGDYLALATLGSSFIAHAVFTNWTGITRGSFGLSAIPKPEIFGVEFSSDMTFLVLAAAIVAIVYLLVSRLCDSQFGKLLGAVRDDEVAARSLGKDTDRLKSISLAVSALVAGISGSLYASYLTFIDPSAFTFSNLLPVLVIVIIGGLAHLPGTVLMTVLIILIPEPLRLVGLPLSILGPSRQIIYALIILLIIYYKPRGFFRPG